MKPETEVTELGDERRCRTCGELWPADGEFYARSGSGDGYLSNDCKACKAQARKLREAA